jgi:endonuclease/exonuclease/phosphatase (EEP) superfamily protein YafD
VVVAALALVKLLGERWWPATALLFGPRWAFLFPIPPLALWAAVRRRWRHVAVQGLALVVVAWPLMGLRLPLSRLASAAPGGERVRVLSLNRGADALDSRAFTRLLADNRYDVVCLQEVRPDPVLEGYFGATGWACNVDKSIWTRLPIDRDLGALPTEAYERAGAWSARVACLRVRLKNGRRVVVSSVHMPTMTYAFQGLARGDLDWFRYYVNWRSRQADRVIETIRKAGGDDPVIVGGDFNMPPDSPIMLHIRDPFASGFEEVGWGYGYTRPSRLAWVGIDRVLASRDCRFVSSRVGPLVGSDHRPIDAEVAVPGSGP